MAKLFKLTNIMLLSFILVNSCDSKSFFPQFITRNMTYVEFDKVNLLDKLSKNVIIPEYNNFYLLSEDLNNKASLFVNNPTEESLIEIQNIWKKLITSWQKITVFEFGPVKTLNVSSKIFFSPVKEQSIKDVLIKEKESLNDNFLDSVGVTKKGLPVIEFLIFNKDKGNNYILSSFKESVDFEKRKIYLKLLTNDLKNNANEIKKAWDINQGNYLKQFINEKNSFNMLLNNIISVLENIKDTKLGTPMGKKSGGELRLNEIESLPSNYSKNNIINNIISIKSIFNGSYNNSESFGLNDYLIYIDKRELKEQIISQIDKTINLIQTLNPSLEYSIKNEPEKVENVYNEVREILKLIKVDTSNSLSETVTFNSSDGD